jgi:hypothetical protein
MLTEEEEDQLKAKLKEALQLAADRGKALEKERIRAANLEVELGVLKNNHTSTNSSSSTTTTNKKIDAKEESEIKYNELNHAYQELLEVERLRTSKMDFHTAASLPKSKVKRPWIAAVNALHFYKVLHKASIHAIEHNDPWKKLLFDVDTDGQISTAKLEQEEEDS